MSAGIDYGLGKSNINVATGIRYGVISQNSVSQALADSNLEYDYGDPTCPKCGNDVVATEAASDVEYVGKDYVCLVCEQSYWSEQVFGEAVGWSYTEDGYKLTDCLDNDVFVLDSPFYTFARYCSPCVPGAGNLDDHDADGVKTYCLGHDWFEDGRAPYPVHDVKTGKLVEP